MYTSSHLFHTFLYTIILTVAKAQDALTPNYTSPLGVEIYNPPQSFDPNGPWSMVARAGPILYVAGMIPRISKRCYPLFLRCKPIGRHARFPPLQQ